jgi:hypothetical protein
VVAAGALLGGVLAAGGYVYYRPSPASPVNSVGPVNQPEAVPSAPPQSGVSEPKPQTPPATVKSPAAPVRGGNKSSQQEPPAGPAREPEPISPKVDPVPPPIAAAPVTSPTLPDLRKEALAKAGSLAGPSGGRIAVTVLDRVFRRTGLASLSPRGAIEQLRLEIMTATPAQLAEVVKQLP